MFRRIHENSDDWMLGALLSIVHCDENVVHVRIGDDDDVGVGQTRGMTVGAGTEESLVVFQGRL